MMMDPQHTNAPAGCQRAQIEDIATAADSKFYIAVSGLLFEQPSTDVDNRTYADRKRRYILNCIDELEALQSVVDCPVCLVEIKRQVDLQWGGVRELEKLGGIVPASRDPIERLTQTEFKRLALLGYPVSHSFSPIMQRAACAVMSVDWDYVAVPVEPSRLHEAVAAVRGKNCMGANVTVPHKEAIIPLLDGLTPVAEAIGAVNTIVKTRQFDGSPSPLSKIMEPQGGASRRGTGGEVLIGHNTDAAGLLADLYGRDVHISHRPVMILGAGGAARAAVAACAGAYADARIRVVARRREQAQSLISICPSLEVFDWSPLGFRQASDDCALIINTTPLGMTPNAGASPWLDGTPFPPDAFVYDLVYNPAETLFTRQAREAGLRAATGLGMLVEQGALAFEMWTGKAAPRDLMRRAAEEKLYSLSPLTSDI
jgi:shikimate dehydrogenase